MEQYQSLLAHVLNNGTYKPDRTNTGTYSVFGHQMRFDLQKGFPLVTTKKVYWKGVVAELLWFLQGRNDVQWLQERGCNIWNEWMAPWTDNRPVVEVVPRKAVAGGEVLNKVKDVSPTTKEDKHLSALWRLMLARCYDKTANNYRFYGGAGVTVHPRWHRLSAFLEDVKKLPHWRYKQAEPKKFQLDKDYYGAKQYGPGTCVWLPESENIPSFATRVTLPDGKVRLFSSLKEAAVKLGVSSSSLHRFSQKGILSGLKAKNKKLNGALVEAIGKDVLYRKELIPDGSLGPIYGVQWRSWPNGDEGTIDQLSEVLGLLKTDPSSRRMVVSAWNVAQLKDMALMPCHTMFQFYVADGKLSCQLYQRSADVFLGVPFNIASYALLTHLMAQQTGLEVGEFIWTGGDVHLYSNHVEQAQEQLKREPFPLPKLVIKDKAKDLFSYDMDSFELEGYVSHPPIKAPVAV